jgi:hypothetical protein
MKSFHHFAGGYIMDDWTINRWIKDCLKAIKSGKPHWSISSGDTSVIALKYDTEIQVIVANDSGKSTMRFSLSPGYEDELVFEDYVRPVPVLA